MRLTHLILVLLLSAAASAQIEPEAATWMQCAAERHGLASTAFRNSVDVGSVTYFGPTGEPIAALDVESVLDLENERLRFDFFIAGMRVLAQQLVAGEGFIYTAETGAVPLPRSERENLRRSFFTGPFAVLPGVVHESARVTLDSPFLEGRAVRVDFVTEGVEHAIFLAEDCTLVGDFGIDPDLGETLAHYTEFATVDGFLIATVADLYAMGMLFGTIETASMAINVVLDEARFEVP